MFKVGQRVWEFVRGWGKVEEILEGAPYPVSVIFETEETESYTSDGREYESCPRVLFFKEFSAPDDALIPPVEYMNLLAGDVVLTTDKSILYVYSDSPSNKPDIKALFKIPRKLDDEYDVFSFSKHNIKKVIGNTRD